MHTPSCANCAIDYGHGHDVDLIDFCPLHAAAPRMLAWIKRMAYWAGELEDSPKSFAEWAQAQMDEARAAIALAKGEKS